jgi:hypothetical protein
LMLNIHHETPSGYDCMDAGGRAMQEQLPSVA